MAATTNLNQGFPGSTQQFVDENGVLSQTWYQFFMTLFLRSGGAQYSQSLGAQLDASIGTDPGSFVYRGSSQWQEFPKGAEGTILQITGGNPTWGAFSATNFGAQTAGTFLASPAAATGNPSFRQINSLDLAGLSGQYPGTTTNDGAAAGNIGEYLAVSPAAVSMTTATIKDVASLALTAGDWDVWGSIATTPAGTTTQSQLSAWLNLASATDPGAPNAGAYVQASSAVPAGLPQVFPVGMKRVSVAAAGATVYLSAKVTFATSTLTASGSISARRVR